MTTDRAALSLMAAVHADEQHRAIEVARVLALVEGADAYELDADPSLPDALRMRRLSAGRDGVPGVDEAFLLEAAAALGRSFHGMREWVSQAYSIRARHPRMWELFCSGGLPWWVAREVEEACKELPFEAALEVDRQASHCLGFNSFFVMLDELSHWVLDADPGRAERERELAKQERFVHVGRFEDDHVGLFGKVAAEDGVLFDQALDQIAQTLPAPEVPEGLDERDVARFVRGQRRAAAFGIFARQAIGQDSLMDVELVVHVPAQTPTAGLDAKDFEAGHGHGDAGAPLGTSAYVEGWGRLLTDTLPSFLAGSKVTVRPVLDPNMIPDATGHEPTGRAGPTSMGNLGPLERTAHRAKTAGHWQADQPAPGAFHWASPMGFEYLVTGQGTVRTKTPDIPVPPIPELPPQAPPVHEPPPDRARAA
ncbi:DUF222 domain-containing protein [uncultured Tessaracoccus sp.]|uniref:DUF222 domain-containing protein n=1 Tax=uncultured Tessaracoccus sp. TaxID=905023 RepID=UPI0025E37A61|nr:DUF222 domain-containing protein [uncultured Tessaracoccus sp.]